MTNSKLLRGLLNAVAIELVAAWMILAVFFAIAAGYLVVIASCLFLMTGYMAFCDQLRAAAELRRANEREAAR